MKIKKIISKGRMLAYIIHGSSRVKGQNFLGEPEDFLQVGIMGLAKGTKLKPHYHLPQKKNINKNQEVLIILSGKMEAIFFDDQNNKKVDSAILEGGDILVLLDGGHGFKMLADTSLVEVKQGPYEGQHKDKNYIESFI